jgi:hypothetical protein
MSRERFPLVAGHEAPITVQLINLDSDSGTDPLDLSQANTFEGEARDLETEQDTSLSVSVTDAPNGKVGVDASPLDAGEYALQISFLDTSGQKHIYPSSGDGFRLVVNPAY